MMQRIKHLWSAAGTIRRNAAVIFVLQAATFGLALISNIIIARALGPSRKGVLDLFNLLNSFILDLGLLGFNSGLLYYLTNKGKPLNAVHGTGLAFAMVMGGLAALTGWLGLPIWRGLFPGLDDWVILLAFLITFPLLYRSIASFIMLGINKSVLSYRVALFISAGTFAVVIVLWLLSALRIDTLIVMSAAFIGINALIFLILLGRAAPRPEVDVRLAGNSIKYGLILFVGTVANLVHFRIDQLILNHYFGTDAVGIYAVSVRWAEILLILDGPLTSASLYRVSTASSKEGFSLTNRLSRTQFLLSGSLGLGLIVMAYPLVMILYGEQYQQAVWSLMLLVPGLVLWSSARMMSQYLVYNRGIFWGPPLFSIIGAAVNISLNVLVTAKIGIQGVAIASTISYSLVVGLTLLMYVIIGRKTQSHTAV